MRTPAVAASVAIAALGLPALASAGTTKADRREAKVECRAERAANPVEFRQDYGSFDRCVRILAAEIAHERGVETRKARVECKKLKAEKPVDFYIEYNNSVKTCIRLMTAP